MTALAAIAGVIGGEGIYLARIADVVTAGWLEVAVAAAVMAGALASGRAPVRARAGALAVGAVVAAAVYVAYRLLAFG
jgi:hypothetical protein